MKILCCLAKYGYGDIKSGYSYEYLNYYLSLKSIYPETELFDTSIIFRNTSINISDEIIKIVNQSSPKITFFSIYNYEYDAEKIKNLQKKTTTIAIFMDDIWRLKHSYYWSKYFTYVTSPDVYCVKRFRKKKLKNVIFFPFGVNTEIYNYRSDFKKRYDISFIGSWHPHREWILNKLVQKNFKVFIAGYNWDKSSISFSEMINVFHESCINLNLSNSANWDLKYLLSSWNSFKNSFATPKNKEQLKARIFEIGSTNNFVISYYFEQHHYFFKPNEELVEFKDINDLNNKCRYFLDNPNRRETITRNLHTRINNSFQYKKMFIDLINRIF